MFLKVKAPPHGFFAMHLKVLMAAKTLRQPFFISPFLPDDVIRRPDLWLAVAATCCTSEALPRFNRALATTWWDRMHSQGSCFLHFGLYRSLEPTGLPKAVSTVPASCTVVQAHRWESILGTKFDYLKSSTFLKENMTALNFYYFRQYLREVTRSPPVIKTTYTTSLMLPIMYQRPHHDNTQIQTDTVLQHKAAKQWQQQRSLNATRWDLSPFHEPSHISAGSPQFWQLPLKEMFQGCWSWWW